MKTIGMLAGMSWESSLDYYRVMNQEVKLRLGGLHSARILMHSVDFGPIKERMSQNDWETVAKELVAAAQGLEKAGADMMVIATNTMHKLAPRVEAGITIPLVHIADATAMAAREEGFSRLGLLGTRTTMEDDFYVKRLEEQGLEVLVPEVAADRKLVDRIIFEELCQGVQLYESRSEFLRIMDLMARRGAQAIILGCTEIGQLVHPGDTEVPTLDTCRIHAVRAVEVALGS